MGPPRLQGVGGRGGDAVNLFDHMHDRLVRAIQRCDQAERGEAFVRAILAVTRHELDAERARLRRWQLRLRWRADLRFDDDRLNARARVLHGRIMYWSWPIAGPRGVLP